MAPPSVYDQINDHIHNKRWFTARWLDSISKSTGWPPDLLAKALAIIVVVYCCGSENAHYMANFVLVAFPIIVLYGFPNEAPNKDVLLVYWAFFGSLTLFDRLLEKIPAYYVFKIVMLLLLFVQQFKLGDSIHEQLSSICQKLNLPKMDGASRKAGSHFNSIPTGPISSLPTSQRTGGDMEMHQPTSETEKSWVPRTDGVFGSKTGTFTPGSKEKTASLTGGSGMSDGCLISKSGFIMQDESYFALPEKDAKDLSMKVDVAKGNSKRGSIQKPIEVTQRLSAREELKNVKTSPSKKLSMSKMDPTQQMSVKKMDSLNASLDRMALAGSAIQKADEERKKKRSKRKTGEASKDSTESSSESTEESTEVAKKKKSSGSQHRKVITKTTKVAKEEVSRDSTEGSTESSEEAATPVPRKKSSAGEKRISNKTSIYLAPHMDRPAKLTKSSPQSSTRTAVSNSSGANRKMKNSMYLAVDQTGDVAPLPQNNATAAPANTSSRKMSKNSVYLAVDQGGPADAGAAPAQNSVPATQTDTNESRRTSKNSIYLAPTMTAGAGKATTSQRRSPSQGAKENAKSGESQTKKRRSTESAYLAVGMDRSGAPSAPAQNNESGSSSQRLSPSTKTAKSFSTVATGKKRSTTSAYVQLGMDRPAPLTNQLTDETSQPLSSTKTAVSTKSALAKRRSTESAYLQVGMQQQKRSASPPPLSANDMPGSQRHRGANAMETDGAHALTAGGQNTSDRDNNQEHALVTLPAKKLIFNAPFDFNNITYHMRVSNTSQRRIAYAIKGNCIPRATAYPPSGIIEPGRSLVIAVTVKKFNFDAKKHGKDRLAFDYATLGPEHGDVKTFSHDLLVHASLRRRRNVHIEYNP